MYAVSTEWQSLPPRLWEQNKRRMFCAALRMPSPKVEVSNTEVGGDICLRPQTSVVVTACRVRVLLTSAGQKPRMLLLNIQSYTGELFTAMNSQSPMPMGLRSEVMSLPEPSQVESCGLRALGTDRRRTGCQGFRKQACTLEG